MFFIFFVLYFMCISSNLFSQELDWIGEYQYEYTLGPNYDNGLFNVHGIYSILIKREGKHYRTYIYSPARLLLDLKCTKYKRMLMCFDHDMMEFDMDKIMFFSRNKNNQIMIKYPDKMKEKYKRDNTGLNIIVKDKFLYNKIK